MDGQLKEEILQYFKESGTKPLSVQELEEIFSMQDVEDFKTLVKTLNELELEDSLIRTRKNRYGLPAKMNLIAGKIEMNRKGFAILITDDENEKDVYNDASKLNSAMHQDKVIVSIKKKNNKESHAEEDVIRT